MCSQVSEVHCVRLKGEVAAKRAGRLDFSNEAILDNLSVVGAGFAWPDSNVSDRSTWGFPPLGPHTSPLPQPWSPPQP